MKQRLQCPTVSDAPIETIEGDKGPGTRGSDQVSIDVGETQEHTSIS